jgi:anhydro-N-acetylmuramic acid kinase
MADTSRFIAGGMSGTSADGVDVAIVKIDGRGYDMTAQLVRHHHRPYNRELRQQIFAFRSGTSSAGVSQSTLRQLAQLGREVSLTYAAAVNEALAAARMEATSLAAVAAHGQTLFHDPPNTIQWLDPSLLAAEVGCAVVSDFRRADLAAGGQGAPLVPFADYVLFRHGTVPRMLVNIGGIANVTCLFPGVELTGVMGFDTGPGNCISDHLMRTQGGAEFDHGGRIAMRGKVSKVVFDAVNADPYFIKLGSKSTDGPAMLSLFERAVRQHAPSMSLEDQLATAAAIAANQIHRALFLFGGQFQGELIVSGGGTKNASIMHYLRFYAGSGVPIRTPDEFGVPSQAKEAIAFALLAAATLEGVPSNVPSVTGAKRAVVLGSITPRP